MRSNERYLARTVSCPQADEPREPAQAPEEPSGVDWWLLGTWGLVGVTLMAFWVSVVLLAVCLLTGEPL